MGGEHVAVQVAALDDVYPRSLLPRRFDTATGGTMTGASSQRKPDIFEDGNRSQETNMEYASGLIRLKPGSEDKVAEWRSTIASRLDEAAATLKDEDVQVESWFTIEISGEQYLLWYLRAKSIERVFEVSRKLKHPIDRFHYAVMEAVTAANIIAKPFIDMPRG
jgi:hypothetical protein